MRSTAPVRRMRSCSSTEADGPGMTPERYPGVRRGPRLDMRVAGHAEAPRGARRRGRARGRSACRRPARPAGRRRRRRAAARPRTRSVPLSAPVIANAWQRRAGPAQQLAVAPRLRPPRRASARCRRRAPRRAAAPPPASPCLGGDDVRAPVHAVGEVHVEVAGRAEHHRRCAGSCRGSAWLPGSSDPRYASTSTMRAARAVARRRRARAAC